MALEPYWSDDIVTLWLGDCRKVIEEIPDASVDAVCTDPPYEIQFMSRSWDASGIAFDPIVWRECLRVLKPGGHLLAFGGTRTYHRLAVAIEDAGFEIRDSIHWVFGSGFPKGQDIAKAIDRRREDRAEILQVTAWLNAARDEAGWTTTRMDALFGFNGMASHWTAIASKAAAVPTPEQWDQLRVALGFDDAEIRPLVAKLNGRKGTLGEAWEQREVIGERHSGLSSGSMSVFLNGTTQYENNMVPVTAPASDLACRWEGWNTSLKPAHEPIILARKSTGFNSTVANVLEHGTGALNIDGCRVDAGSRPLRLSNRTTGNDVYGDGLHGSYAAGETTQGRWPTNLVFSHSASCVEDGPCEPDCPVAELNRQSGHRKAGGSLTGDEPSRPFKDAYGEMNGRRAWTSYADQGGASRFFPTFRYEAKAPTSERPKLDDGTAHSTVKPLDLMRWLVRLVTRPGGVVLDPFAGSGTTGEACVLEGFRAVLIELEQPHAELIKQRLRKPLQPALDLFSEVPDGI